MTSAEPFAVEVVYALPDRAIVKTYRVQSPATVAGALALAAADPDFHGVEVIGSPVGIFGRPVPLDRELKPGDRLEIYRPLAADPKDARRLRVQRGRAASRFGRS